MTDDNTVRIRRAITEAQPNRATGRRWVMAGAAALALGVIGGGMYFALGGAPPVPQRLGPRRLTPPLLRTTLRGQSICYALARRSEQDATDPPDAPAPRDRIELLAFNADDLAPRFVVDLASVPAGGLADAELIAEQGATIWVWLGGLGAVSAVDGQVLADTAGIIDLNPEIADYFAGMPRRAFRLADALTVEGGPRAWRIDPRDFKVHATNLPAPRPLPQLTPAAAYGQGGPTAFRVAEARLDADWLAVPAATAKLAAPLRMHGQGRFLPATAMPAGSAQLLWRGGIRLGSGAPPGWPANMPDRWGRVEQVVDLVPVPSTDPLVLAGFLTTGTEAPVVLSGPPSLLLLSGTDAGLVLARIAADGRTAWRAALPIARLHSVLPGASALLLAGGAEGEDRLVAIATGDGAVTSRAISA